MEDRIRTALASHGAALISVKPLHGGACQDNFKVELHIAGKAQTMALRSDAKTSLPGSIRRKAEFSVIEAANTAGVKTPSVRWLTLDLLRPGADAYFLDWVDGEAIGRRVVRNPELGEARTKLPGELAASLARLHTITPGTATLPLTLPRTSPAETALNDLIEIMDRMPGVYPAVEFAHQWLAARIPSEREIVLVHGDFRTGNFMVTPEGLSAVLDWEFARWGSPYEDLGWISVRDWRFGRLDLPVGGFSKRAPFYAAYSRASGRAIDEATVLWWEIVGNLRWALGSVNQGERYLSGEQPDLELIAIARRNVEMEFEALRLIRRERLD
jgi:aminoglycoside phosphotransferase (APT) family kinase protein